MPFPLFDCLTEISEDTFTTLNSFDIPLLSLYSLRGPNMVIGDLWATSVHFFMDSVHYPWLHVEDSTSAFIKEVSPHIFGHKSRKSIKYRFFKCSLHCHTNSPGSFKKGVFVQNYKLLLVFDLLWSKWEQSRCFHLCFCYVYFVRLSINSSTKVPDNRQESFEWRWTKLCFPVHQNGPHPPLRDQSLGVPCLGLHGCAGQLTGQIQQLVTNQEAQPSLRGYCTGYDSRGNKLVT